MEGMESAAQQFYSTAEKEPSQRELFLQRLEKKENRRQNGQSSKKVVIEGSSRDGSAVATKEWSFWCFDKSIQIVELDADQYGYKPAPIPPFNRMPVAALPGAKGNIFLDSTNVGKYKIGMEVVPRDSTSGEKCWVVGLRKRAWQLVSHRVVNSLSGDRNRSTSVW